MLTHFPAPYPGEWWYSVLSRYHIRTGNVKHQTTVKELFGGKPSAAMGAIYPNGGIQVVTSQLPATLLSARAVILGHTLFPYYTRFYTQAEKEAILQRLCMGKTAVITSIRLFSDLAHWAPRYCLQCIEADRQTYGEAYWHIAHQIPLADCCPSHSTRLVQVTSIPHAHLQYTFYPLETLPLGSVTSHTGPPTPLSPLTPILADYQSLPLDAGVTVGYHNLATALANMGYEVIQRHSPHTILDAKRLYNDLVATYGRALVEQIFGGEESISTINRLCKWGMRVPERYALLQHYAGIPSSAVFSAQPLPNCYEERLRSLAQRGVVYGKRQLADDLGVTISQLEILAKRYGVEPFWVRNGPTSEGHLQKLSFQLGEEALARFKLALKKSGYRYDSHFVKAIVLREVERILHDGE